MRSFSILEIGQNVSQILPAYIIKLDVQIRTNPRKTIPSDSGMDSSALPTQDTQWKRTIQPRTKLFSLYSNT